MSSRGITGFPEDYDLNISNREWLLDSVASNAAAHYLHNILFLTGNEMEISADPIKIEAEVYRANPIEMFDTCALRIRTADDAELLFYAAHAVPKKQERVPEFIIEGEQGTVTLPHLKRVCALAESFPETSTDISIEKRNEKTSESCYNG